MRFVILLVQSIYLKVKKRKKKMLAACHHQRSTRGLVPWAESAPVCHGTRWFQIVGPRNFARTADRITSSTHVVLGAVLGRYIRSSPVITFMHLSILFQRVTRDTVRECTDSDHCRRPASSPPSPSPPPSSCHCSAPRHILLRCGAHSSVTGISTIM